MKLSCSLFFGLPCKFVYRPISQSDHCISCEGLGLIYCWYLGPFWIQQQVMIALMPTHMCVDLKCGIVMDRTMQNLKISSSWQLQLKRRTVPQRLSNLLCSDRETFSGNEMHAPTDAYVNSSATIEALLYTPVRVRFNVVNL